MDTILVKCPHCKEQMQAPKGRASIICMFCGKNIDLENQANCLAGNVDTEKKAESLDTIKSDVKKATKEYHKMVRAFKRDSYHDLFEKYKADNYAFFMAVKTCIMNTKEEELPSAYEEIADIIIQNQEDELSQIKKKNDKFSSQMDMNMFMAVFLIPSIKEIGNKRADDLADEICKKWGKQFKDSNIHASDYDSISAGFKRKLCYVTTAVCQNLQFGEDCEVLTLIKDFRDTYLASTEEGKQMIEAYYDIAPTLVKRISCSASPEEKYAWIWEQYLKPCVDYIKDGKQDDCRIKYCEMVETLKEEYIRSK